MTKKNIAIGTSDFRKIIEENSYFFDKTKFIEDIYNDGAEVKLFTRPRRFGKTLNMSMLKNFFDVREKDFNRKLFTNLYIEKSSIMEQQGKYPVILISFADIKQESWEEAEIAVKNRISDVFDEYSFIRDSLNPRNKKLFENIWLNENTERLSTALKDLSGYLYEYYGEKVILLIDEYDTPLASAHQHAYYNKAISFFKTLYSSALKDNNNMKFAVVTGIVRVSNENIFSGLNNIVQYSILDKDYEESFGLSAEEVEMALDYYGMEKNMPLIREWYDGYKFGDFLVYNPWSITNYLKEGKTKPFWVNTSGNYLINHALSQADTATLNDFKQLLSGKSVEKIISNNVTLKDIIEDRDVWALMLFSGYLTVNSRIDTDIYELKIPNKEVMTFFGNTFIRENFKDDFTFKKLMLSLLHKDIKGFSVYLNEIMENLVDFLDTADQEKVYHMFILGMMAYLTNSYYVRSNKASGYGRYDVSLEPKNKNDAAFIFEFKAVKEEKDMKKALEIALNQIEDKDYYCDMRERGIKDITALALVFWKKKVMIKAGN